MNAGRDTDLPHLTRLASPVRGCLRAGEDGEGSITRCWAWEVGSHRINGALLGSPWIRDFAVGCYCYMKTRGYIMKQKPKRAFF